MSRMSCCFPAMRRGNPRAIDQPIDLVPVEVNTVVIKHSVLPSVSTPPVQSAAHACLHAGEQEAGKQSSSQATPNKVADDPRDQQPAEARDNPGEPEAAPVHGPTTSASGMSLQPPSLPAHFSQQQQQQQAMPAQLVAGSVQDRQQAAAAGASPRDAGPLGAAGQKQAHKPPLAPGSKSVPQVQLALCQFELQRLKG